MMQHAPAKKHYFIALVPQVPLREAIDALKTEVKNRFGAAHALKSPAHITLQMPFHKRESEEPELLQCLSGFASGEAGFRVSLNGFDCFPPRVIFVKVANPLPIQKLHSRLKNVLVSELGFPENTEIQKFHPHLTIATRDLTEASFLRAWADFGRRTFQAGFPVKSLFLLKHNGKTWDIFHEFPFPDAPVT